MVDCCHPQLLRLPEAEAMYPRLVWSLGCLVPHRGRFLSLLLHQESGVVARTAVIIQEPRGKNAVMAWKLGALVQQFINLPFTWEHRFAQCHDLYGRFSLSYIQSKYWCSIQYSNGLLEQSSIQSVGTFFTKWQKLSWPVVCVDSEERYEGITKPSCKVVTSIFLNCCVFVQVLEQTSYITL